MRGVWQQTSLGEICDLINRGISPKYVESGGIRVVNQRCIREHHVDYEVARRHDSSAKKVSPERFLRKGDAVVNSTGTGTLGRVAWLLEEPEEPTTVDSHVTILRPRASVFYPSFFGYVLSMLEKQLQESGEGCGGQTELSREKIANFSVTFPSDKKEQERIVAILDQAFEGISTMEKTGMREVDAIRSAFTSALREVFASSWLSGIPARLIDLATDIVDGDHMPPPKKECGVPFVTISNVDKRSHQMDFSATYFVSREYFENLKPNRKPRRGDVLYSVTGSFGIPVRIDDETEFCF